MPDVDIHPELRQAARFIPRRRSVYRATLPLLRRFSVLPSSNDGVEVLTLPSGPRTPDMVAASGR